jgi:hypothetical protein
MSQALAIDYAYRYPFPSRLLHDRSGSHLSLATSSSLEHNAYFFTGLLTSPKLTAELLLLLSEVSRTRYFSWQAYREAQLPIISLADPVVTSGGEHLRFEAFSVCGGVYARLDMLPTSVEGDWCGRGTTNVDFNQTMRDLLARITAQEQVRINVGTDQLEIERAEENAIEKKVALPDQWLKGFVEVQAYQAKMTPFCELSGAQTEDFLQAIPAQTPATKGDGLFLIPEGKTVRITRRHPMNGIPVGAPGRLKTAQRVAHMAKRVRIYSEPGGSTAWEFDFVGMRFTVAITADASRGFAGEGQVLEHLVRTNAEEVLARVKASLQWQARLDAANLASDLKLNADAVRNALSILGTRGLVGFDLHENTYFHRELPFCSSLVEKTQPRLASARKLVKSSAVRIVRRDGNYIEAYTPGENGDHFIYFNGSEQKCTCPWFVRHAGARGPCRHVLAVQLKVAELDSQPGS